jgi:hypothetical protein
MHKRFGVRLLLTLGVGVMTLVFSTGSSAQLSLPTIPSWAGQFISQMNGDVLTVNSQTLLTNSASTREELPGLGHKFELLGVMVTDRDPENTDGGPGGSGGGGGGNEVVSATMTPPDVALAFRSLPQGITIRGLTNQLGLKYFFVAPRTCGGGSPRMTLLIDSDGDSDIDFAAHGHVNPPAYTACITNEWQYEDLTDAKPRWEVTPGGTVPGIPVFPFTAWDAFAAAVTTAFPNHRVYAGFLVEDSCGFFAATCGKAYYDLVTVENRTLEIWQDTVKN